MVQNMKRAADLVRRYSAGERGFHGVQLRQANLNGADLAGADLSAACLKGASLLGADLRGAKLTRADVVGADFGQADLRGTDLRGTRLGQANLRLARYDIATRFPGGFSPVDGGLVPDESGVVRRTAVRDVLAVLDDDLWKKRGGNG